MIAVITGDIINSRKSNQKIWLRKLKSELKFFGKSPSDWEIFRGDSFQIRVKDPRKAVIGAIEIKSALKSIKDLDARIAIGIGEGGKSTKIKEAFEYAFILSGEKLEELKKEKVNLGIKTLWKEFDSEINLYLKLGLIAMDNWTETMAQMVKYAITYPDKSQEELGLMLKKSQNTVSQRLKRAYFNEIMEIDRMYQFKIKQRI